MPTNFIRNEFTRKGARPPNKEASVAGRFIELTVGQVKLRLRLLDTRTADLIWSALPLFSIAETWGDSIHFETPLRTGRERTAKLNVEVGEVCFWTEDERVVLAWGPTPISRPGEVRLMRPCNIWARVEGDAALLSVVTPGEKVSLRRQCDDAEGRI